MTAVTIDTGVVRRCQRAPIPCTVPLLETVRLTGQGRTVTVTVIIILRTDSHPNTTPSRYVSVSVHQKDGHISMSD
jgi:hypothetical protein